MNKYLLNVAGAFYLSLGIQAMAAPLLPGMASAYMTCNTCGVSSPASDLASPIAGYSFVVSATRPITMNNVYTGFTNKTVGTLLDVVWRKSGTPAPTCIYGTKVTLSLVDYDVNTSGAQYFDMRDIARGGYSNSGNLDVAFSTRSIMSLQPSRAGRTYTSVVATGLPPLGGSSSIDTAIADVNSNWVDFTTRAIASTFGAAYPVSAMVYVTAACDSSTPFVANNAIRLRQTIPPFIQISVPGYVPPNGTDTPAPVIPY